MKKLLLTSCLLIFTIITASGQNIDLRFLEYINGPNRPADKTWHFVSNSMLYVSIATPASMIVTGLASNNKELTTKGLETVGSIVIAEGATLVLKNVVKRERPDIAHPDLIYGKTNAKDYSFPSGHTSVAFATATSLSLSFPKWYVIAPAYTYAAAVGYSRMYLGVHYPSDVFAGALVGAGSSFLTWKLQKLLNKKYTHN